MELRVTTESGSVYFLSKNTMTWDRVKFVPHPEDATNLFPLRTPGGELVSWPEVTVGQPIDIVGPPLTVGATVRLVRTSPVVAVEEVSAN